MEKKKTAKIAPYVESMLAILQNICVISAHIDLSWLERFPFL